MQVRISAWIICFIFVKKIFCSVLHFFSFFKSDFYPFACFSLPTLFSFARFFFIINVGPVCPSEVVAWWAE